MAAVFNEDEPSASAHDESRLRRKTSNGKPSVEQVSEPEEDDDDDGDDIDDADEEPKLKYTRLTSSLAPVYRNGDATSTSMVAGDKMVWRMLLGPRLLLVRGHILSSR